MAQQSESDRGFSGRLVQGAMRGAIAAMAMTGVREFARHVEAGPRRAQVELAHWGYGAAAGACFAALPRLMRRAGWSGPVYGLLVWAGFELGIAPALSLSRSRRRRVSDALALVADHVLYAYLQSENSTLRSRDGRAQRAVL